MPIANPTTRLSCQQNKICIMHAYMLLLLSLYENGECVELFEDVHGGQQLWQRRSGGTKRQRPSMADNGFVSCSGVSPRQCARPIRGRRAPRRRCNTRARHRRVRGRGLRTRSSLGRIWRLCCSNSSWPPVSEQIGRAHV